MIFQNLVCILIFVAKDQGNVFTLNQIFCLLSIYEVSSISNSLLANFFSNIYTIIYNLHGLSYQEKVSRFSMLPIARNGTSLAFSHWKLRIILMVEYRSSRLNQSKPFSGPVSTLLSSSAEFYRVMLANTDAEKIEFLLRRN